MTCFGDLLAGLGTIIASIVMLWAKRVKSRVPKVGANPDSTCSYHRNLRLLWGPLLLTLLAQSMIIDAISGLKPLKRTSKTGDSRGA